MKAVLEVRLDALAGNDLPANVSFYPPGRNMYSQAAPPPNLGTSPLLALLAPALLQALKGGLESRQ